MSASFIPDGKHSVTPYIVVQGVGRLIDFVQRAFEGQEMGRMPRPDGSIAHAEVKVGDSVIMMGEPASDRKPMPAMLYLYVADTDATYRRAIDAGATSIMEPADKIYGDRNAGVKDPMGNEWWIGTHKENVSVEEVQRRMDALQK